MLQCEVINGNEKGSDIQTICDYSQLVKQKLFGAEHQLKAGSLVDINPKDKISDELFPNKDNFVFLDHSNGDYYCYNNPNLDGRFLTNKLI